MELKLYPLLGTRTKRAMSKIYGQKWLGNGESIPVKYHYVPRQNLLKRLAEKTGLPIPVVKETLLKERLEILRKTNPGQEFGPNDV